jgi:hypothetical protein
MLAVQCMAAPAGQVHVVSAARGVQSAQLQAQAPGVLRIDAGFRAGTKEPLKRTVPERLDHPSAV